MRRKKVKDLLIRKMMEWSPLNRMLMQKKIKKEKRMETIGNRAVIRIGKIMIPVSYKLQAVRNASINFATPKKSIRKFAREFKPNATDSYAKIVMKIMSITLSVNSVNKFIQIMRMKKMIQNG